MEMSTVGAQPSATEPRLNTQHNTEMETKTMTRIQRIALIALAVAVVESGAAAALLAQGPGGRGAGAPPDGRAGARGFAAGFALGQLDLSDAQKQQVRDITQRHRADAEALQTRLTTALQAQQAAITTVPVNEALIRSASQDLAAVQADMAVDRARLHADIFAILTVEQQVKAKQLQEQAQAKLQERRQRTAREPKGQV
jgi:Spy/CpxP family protein refolding chaperone